MIGSPTQVRRLPYRHLADLTDGRGLFEHARHAEPRVDHGYCLDDVARALVIVVRERQRTPLLDQLTETYLRFVEQAVHADGRARNRMDVGGTWADDLAVSDWWGRAVAALGFTVAHSTRRAIRVRAMTTFLRAARQRPVDVRSAAFAAMGAADVLSVRPVSRAARRLLIDLLPLLPRTAMDEWTWVEPRLRYANGALAEALLAGGVALDDASLVADGLAALEALVAIETRDNHLSVTGHGGRGPDDRGATYDQQPIEVAAIADAAARAWAISGDQRWRDVVRMSWNWFEGDNDGGMPMIDPTTGAGYDGLEADGRNDNRGAESTLAALGTNQRMQAIGARR